jgi:ataxin-3
MESIFHETQEGALCAQHCLNSLLQGDYYSAVDLANIAHELDTIERNFMQGEGTGNNSATNLNSNQQQESSNYDDTGFFSIQVLQHALKSWNLDLVPYSSSNEIAKEARQNPTEQKAYICNFRHHWYTIRKIGSYWFNLNSLLRKPEFVSDTHLSILLFQLINDGYSIFIVYGELPQSQADVQLAYQVLNTREILNEQNARKKNQIEMDDEDSNDPNFDDELKKALRMSLIENDLDLDRHHGLYPSLAFEQYQPQTSSNAYDEDKDLKRALALSLESEKKQEQTVKNDYVNRSENDSKQNPSAVQSEAAAPVAQPVNIDEVRKKRLEYLEKMSQQNKTNN